MRQKYVEERYPSWFTTGTYPDGRKSLLLAHNTDRETEVAVIPEDADKIMKEHDLLLDKLCEIAVAWAESDNESFTKFWYG